jgi:hypothetical protein
MSVDPSLVQFYSGFNAYKNTGVKSGTTTVSGTLAAGTAANYNSTVTLDEVPVYFTVLVRTTSLVGGTTRWQALPSSVYYDVPCSGPASSLTVFLTLIVNGSDITLRASALNPFVSTLTWTTTNIEFKYVPYTLVS